MHGCAYPSVGARARRKTVRVLPLSGERSVYLVFHVDHSIAKQHLDEISDDLELLAWACSECNYHKGPNLVSIDPESKESATLFSPRRDDWNAHFRVEHGMVIGLSPSGRATARLLNMNALRLVRLRRELVEQGIF